MNVRQTIDKCVECAEVSDRELADVRVTMENVVQYLTAKSKTEPHAQWLLKELGHG